MPTVSNITIRNGEQVPQEILDAVGEIRIPFSSETQIVVTNKPAVEIVDFNGNPLEVVNG